MRKFSAVQLTYNYSHGDFMALDHGVIFGRLVAYLGRLAEQVSAEGVSATVERASPDRVHLHCAPIFIYQLPSIEVVRMPSTSLPSKACGGTCHKYRSRQDM